MASFSNFPLGRNELREYDVLPTTDCGNQPERLEPTGSLALPCCPPPQRGLGTVQEHVARFSGAPRRCHSDGAGICRLSPVERATSPGS